MSRVVTHNIRMRTAMMKELKDTAKIYEVSVGELIRCYIQFGRTTKARRTSFDLFMEKRAGL